MSTLYRQRHGSYRVIQPDFIGPVRIEPVTEKLIRLFGPSDCFAIFERVGATRDGSKRLWWLPASRLDRLRRELEREVDPLFRGRTTPR